MQTFEKLFSRYFRQVYGFALSLTRDEGEAEDLAQHTFYKALEKIDSFQGRSDPAMRIHGICIPYPSLTGRAMC